MPYQMNKSMKEPLGFAKGYITIFQGDTFPYSSWFRSNKGRYSSLFGWYIDSNTPIPDDIPEDLTPTRLNWTDIIITDDILKSEEEIRAIVDKLLYPEPEGEWVGEIGERISIFLTVKKVINMGGYYGESYLHIMEDDFFNTFIWITSSKKLSEGSVYCIRGTVKERKIYRGRRQNILSRCTIIN